MSFFSEVSIKLAPLHANCSSRRAAVGDHCASIPTDSTVKVEIELNVEHLATTEVPGHLIRATCAFTTTSSALSLLGRHAHCGQQGEVHGGTAASRTLLFLSQRRETHVVRHPGCDVTEGGGCGGGVQSAPGGGLDSQRAGRADASFCK